MKIPELNDSKYIGIAIYNVALLCGIGAPVVAFLEEEKDLAYVLVGVFILLATTVTVAIVFITKVQNSLSLMLSRIISRGIRR